MTTVLTRPRPATPAEPMAWSIGAPRLLAGLDRGLAHLDRTAHYAVHGPQPAVDPPRLLGMLDGVGLAGRGGAGFPLAAKIRALPADTRREVVINGVRERAGEPEGPVAPAPLSASRAGRCARPGGHASAPVG